MQKVEDHLTLPGNKSPFTVVQRAVSKDLTETDKAHLFAKNRTAPRHILGIQTKLQEILDATYDSFDHLIKRTAEDPKEKPVGRRWARRWED